jgi:hypothetical protein
VTRDLLREQDIPFIANPGGTHSPSVDIGLDAVSTRYALLVDTDVLFLRSLVPLYRTFCFGGFTLMGEVQGSREGFATMTPGASRGRGARVSSPTSRSSRIRGASTTTSARRYTRTALPTG